MKRLLVLALLLAGCAATGGGERATPTNYTGRMVRVEVDNGQVYECVSVSTSVIGNTGSSISTLTFGQLINCKEKAQ